MKRVNDYIRDRLLKDLEPKRIPTMKEIFEANWSLEFETYMRNRLAMGFFRYGPLSSQKKGGYDNIGSVLARLKLWKESGNDEYLVDCANLCMVEFIKGNHPKKHFASIDDGIHTKKIQEL